jgi:transposase
MQKALMEMNLQLHHVVSDITGVTGMRIIRALVGGERDLDILASYRDVRCHASVETIKPRMLVATALANKLARTVWALTTTKENYRIPPLAA